MSGTSAGGKRAQATNKRIYGDDFYVLIGKMGGMVSGKNVGRGGFAKDPELAKRAGRIGGANSKRLPVEPVPCPAPGCTRNTHANGYCQRHYQQTLRSGGIHKTWFDTKG